MTPGRGSEPEEPATGSHPAAGGDWAADLDWVDPREPPPAPAKRRFRLFSGAGLRTPGTHGTPGTSGTPGPRGAPRTPRPPRTPAQRRILRRRIVALSTLAFVVFAAWFLISLFQPFHGGGSGSVTVSVPKGSSVSDVADELAHDGVISSTFFFDLRAKLDGNSGKLRAGVYTLRRGMSYSAALSALTSTRAGAAAEISFTVPEGDTRAQIAGLAARAGLRGDYGKASTPKATGFSPQAYGAHKGVDSLEGFLFPDTYFLFRHANVSTLIAKQLAAFKQTLADVNLSYAKSRNLTDYDVLTIASIIEREAQLPSDGPKVAAVIYNRLRLGIALGLDTTLLYYLHNPKGGLTESDLQNDTPYNTRKHLGLPPTPISNPGLQALDAAAHPAHVNYLYFVVKPNACGALAFTASATVFDEDVAAYNAAVKADGGKLPDGCPTAKKHTKK